MWQQKETEQKTPKLELRATSLEAELNIKALMNVFATNHANFITMLLSFIEVDRIRPNKVMFAADWKLLLNNINEFLSTWTKVTDYGFNNIQEWELLINRVKDLFEINEPELYVRFLELFYKKRSLLSIIKFPGLLPSYLDLVANSPQSDIIDIFCNSTATNMNAVMVAAKRVPLALSLLIKSKAWLSLTLKTQAALLKQVNHEESFYDSNWNALLFAAFHNPKTVSCILDAMDILSIDDQAHILKTVVEPGWNALMWAARSKNSEALGLIFNKVAMLPFPYRSIIFMQTASSSQLNALKIIARFQPTMLSRVLPHYKDLIIRSLKDYIRDRELQEEKGFFSLGSSKANKINAAAALLDVLNNVPGSSLAGHKRALLFGKLNLIYSVAKDVINYSTLEKKASLIDLTLS